MPEVPVWIPEHVFISYSHIDREVAQRVRSDLENAGISTWIDDDRLEPGTPNWEQTVRNAIARSFAVVLIASPQSQEARYVQAELLLAEGKKRQVIPVWVEGNQWEECVPMHLFNAQYVDCRAPQYDVNFSKLEQKLRKIRDDESPQHKRLTLDYIEDYKIKYGVDLVLNRQDYIYIELANQDVVAMRYDAYPTINKLTDDLYMEYLQDRYVPLTYGEQWLLGTHTNDDRNKLMHLLVPWIWLTPENRNLSRLRPVWSNFSPKEWFELPHLHHLRVLDRLPQFVVGIATNIDHAAQELRSHDSKTGFVLGHASLDLISDRSRMEHWFNHIIRLAEWLEVVNLQEYQYHFVMTSGLMSNSQQYVRPGTVSCVVCIIQDPGL